MSLRFDIEEIAVGLLLWAMTGFLSWVAKKFRSPGTFPSYFFAIVLVFGLFVADLFLLNSNYTIRHWVYLHAVLLSVLFLFTHLYIWRKQGLPRKAKKILKLFPKTGNVILTEEQIRDALGLGIHSFEYLMDHLIGIYLETNDPNVTDRRKYWLLPKGRSFLARRLLLR